MAVGPTDHMYVCVVCMCVCCVYLYVCAFICMCVCVCVCVCEFLKKNVMPTVYVITSKGPRKKGNTGTVMLEPPLSAEIFSYCKTGGHAGSLGGC